MLKFRASICCAYLVLNACSARNTALPPSFVESKWTVISPTNVSDLKLIDHLELAKTEGQYYQSGWSPDGKYLAIASSIGLYLVDSKTLQVVTVFEKEQNIVGAAFSPDSQQLALAKVQGRWGADTCGTTQVSIWDVATRTLLRTLEFNECDRATFVAFTQGGNNLTVVLTELEANPIQIWDTATWNIKRNIQVGAGGLWNVSPDASKLMFSPFGNGITFIDVDSGEQTHYMEMHASSQAISSNGLFALGSFTGSNSSLEVGEVASLEKIWSVQLNNECTRISSIAFAPKNPVMAIGCSKDSLGQNGTIRVYNSATGEVLAKIASNFLPNHGLAFSPNGYILAAMSPTGELILWGVPAGSR